MSKWEKFSAMFKKWWPSIVPVLITLWSTYGTQVTAWVSAHPKYTVYFSAVSMILTHLLRSPLQQPKT